MNKSELIEALSAKSGESKASCERVLTSLIDTLGDAMKNGDKIQLIGFGTFEAPLNEACTRRNPATGQEIQVPAKRVPKLKFGKPFKDKVA